MKQLLIGLSLAITLAVNAQTVLVLKSPRPPQLDLTTYSQIAVGDIVGPLGAKTEQSLDLTDALTAKLFNANTGGTIEILDRSALDNLLGSQKNRDLQVIDETTKALLNKKLKNALLITGRIQSRPLEQKLIYEDQAISFNGCNRTYYYQVKGDVTIQLKILDVRTGKMLYSDGVIKPVDKQTKSSCQTPEKLDLGDISRNAIKDLADEISKMLVPYEVSTTLQFSNPGLLKSPFKQLREAVGYLEVKNTDAGLAILKSYTESSDIKDKNKDDAWFNYGLGLVYAGKHIEAKTALQTSASMNAGNVAPVTFLIKLMDEEAEIKRKLEAQELARQKATEPVATEVKPALSTQKKPAKTTKAKTKSA